MTKKKRFGVSQALSRGLSETINVVENNSGIFRNIILPLSRIELDPDNPRKLAVTLSDICDGIDKNDPFIERKNAEVERLQELASTIESSGVINPIVVYKRNELYRVVAGERRCLASILAGKHEIEARVYNEKPKGFELKLIQWIENTAREDLTLEERINNIQDIITEYQHQHPDINNLTATLLKNIIGLSLPQATYYLAVINAPDDVKKQIECGNIRSLDKAAIICGIDSEEVREEALKACIEGCSLKELRKIITRSKQVMKHASPMKASVEKRGRTISRINMGFTLNTNVIQTLVESVINRIEYKKYAHNFINIDWARLDQTSKAFKTLVEILEHEFVK